VVLVTGSPAGLLKYRQRLRRRFPRTYATLRELRLKFKRTRTHKLPVTPEQKDGIKGASVLTSEEALRRHLERIRDAQTGKSVVVSGPFEEIRRVLETIGLCPHTVQFSLGCFGRTELLPQPKVLEITTMCGHHMIAPTLVKALASDVAKGKASRKDTVQVMARLCTCGIFNEARADRILEELTEGSGKPEKASGHAHQS